MYAIKYETYRYETTSEECAFRFKQIIKDKMKQLGTEKYVNIYSGILLGDRQEIDEETISVYKYAGISHILSISGPMKMIRSNRFMFIFQKARPRRMRRKSGSRVQGKHCCAIIIQQFRTGYYED